MIVTLVLIAVSGVAAAVAAVVRSPTRPGRYVVRRVPQSDAPLPTARLTPSPRAIAGRPPAASTASQVHVITDAPWRNPGRTERSQR